MMVVDEGRLVGLLSLKDLMKFIALKVELEDDTTASLRQARQRENSTEHQPISERIRSFSGEPSTTLTTLTSIAKAAMLWLGHA